MYHHVRELASISNKGVAMTMKRARILGCVLLVALVTRASGGGLSPVASDPDAGIFPPLLANGSLRETPPSQSDALSSRAKVTRARTVKFSLDKISVQGDLPVFLITTPGGWYGSRPDAPEVEVIDANGKLVDKFALEYG